MGQKVNPTGFRLGGVYTWSSRWFATRQQYRDRLRQDVEIRRYLKRRLKDASVSKVEIERSQNAITVILHTAKPGLVIGRGGQGVEELQQELKKKVLEPKMTLQLNIQEVDQPNLSAALTVQSVAADIEKRIPFRRAMRQAMSRLVKAGAAGVKIQVAGRLNGAEIARTEKVSHGTLPLQTMRAQIDYSRGVAQTTYGVIGIKAWVYRDPKKESAAPQRRGSRRDSANRS
ncbi:30S ribosomal protein S3 [Candidatus Uhrbacteria bacterium CG10_big_fil_rev_8_21_14_0_10_48_11]|uniref:Small ribosomal subunit protein uS3 n=1 Tax=Candidatus Uhrbacteria bacterium CG10_big_fil_rev_8_21_14_0_10_48_11 TaxID=1975037 RepID=A0A2M8LF07_9BACT|nr:MAG: 30S ribosomal protein S3 [Candidatus Uhrbacteria bacterium CG10_big_fil_rev_8_21_14_0_10_48_11]